MSTTLEEKIRAATLGLAVGDALGVPVEFCSRSTLKANPVTHMRGYGTHHQPAGTWSDDSSLTFCLMEALCSGYNLEQIGTTMLAWYQQARWTAHGEVFDIGISTQEALDRLASGTAPSLTGNFDERSNGNGSLMRILPMLFYTEGMTRAQTYTLIEEVSGITHAHVRAKLACLFYVEFARAILQGAEAADALPPAISAVQEQGKSGNINPKETGLFERLNKQHILQQPEAAISSSGYVMHTLEAAIWVLLHSGSYEETVLKVVNLGEDTDTTAAVAGSLAGLVYGVKGIPQKWLQSLAGLPTITLLIDQFADSLKPA